MLVSICMAVHNSAAFIRNTLSSVQKQTYKDFECIIVDDYSADDTVNIIYEEFCKTDKRFKLFINQTDPNKPYVDSHNLSYELASGKYLIRMDHDDEMFPDCVEFQVNFMEEHPEIDASCVNMLRAGENPDGTLDKTTKNILLESKEKCDIFNQYNVFAYHCYWACWFNSSSCLRKSFFDTVHPRYEILKTGDWLFWWRCLAGGARMYTHYEPKIYYRDSNHSLSTQDRFKTVSPDDYDYQILVAKYKAQAFKIRGNEVYPDGLTAMEAFRVFDNTVNYFKNLKSSSNG